MYALSVYICVFVVVFCAIMLLSYMLFGKYFNRRMGKRNFGPLCNLLHGLSDNKGHFDIDTQHCIVWLGLLQTSLGRHVAHQVERVGW